MQRGPPAHPSPDTTMRHRWKATLATLLAGLLLPACGEKEPLFWGNPFENLVAVAGYVETEEGQRVDGVVVRVVDSAGRVAGSVASGPSASRPDMAPGRFWIEMGAAGEYSLEVTPPQGYGLAPGQQHPVPVSARVGLPPDLWIRLRRE
jgi:hypothetical protein